MKLTLNANANMKIDAYADSSFAVHHDYKGQTGTCISIGKGMIYCKSSKQKLVAKSSTESELMV